ncbi:MAG: hypothetical protein QG655_3694 [Actinomycetota bacterium]|nr:hypothetical protein [Actinomycetota bacterium]
MIITDALLIVLLLAVVVLLLAVLLLGYRLWKMRQGGTAAILRDTPAVAGHGWRHGVIRYHGDEASFYRLSSLRPWPDRRLGRRGLEIVARRAPRGDEFDIMTDATVVLELVDASTDRQRCYEMALDRGALTAFLSWVESRPSPRARRRAV